MIQASTRSNVSGHFFDELKGYVGFDREVEQSLRRCEPIVEPHYDAIVGSFYDALIRNPRTQSVFDGPEQLARLQATLGVWLHEAFRGPWNGEYFQRRRRIGRVHVEVGLLPHFMSGAMNIVRRHVLRVLYAANADIALIESAEILLDLELAIMLQGYWDHMMELKLTVPVALATGLAHEIRNPLNAINLNLKILERRLQALGAEDSGPIMDAVKSEVRRIAGLANDIMDFAKPVDVHLVWHRADKFLAEIHTMHAAAFAAAGVTLRVEARGDANCYCDIDRMRQVIVNLLSNALDAVEPGGDVSVIVDSNDETTTLMIKDDGHGMEPSAVYQIFHLFYTQKASGTGLGLPIVKNVIDAHGGMIDVETKVGKGTTFTIRLPKPQRSRD